MTEAEQNPEVPPESWSLSTDERGRITIPKEARERYGGQYRLVEQSGTLVLYPLNPEDNA